MTIKHTPTTKRDKRRKEEDRQLERPTRGRIKRVVTIPIVRVNPSSLLGAPTSDCPFYSPPEHNHNPLYFAVTQKECCFLDSVYLETYLICSTAEGFSPDSIAVISCNILFIITEKTRSVGVMKDKELNL